jgi:homoserine kinase
VKELQAKSNYPSCIIGVSSSSATIIAGVQSRIALYNKGMQSDALLLASLTAMRR